MFMFERSSCDCQVARIMAQTARETIQQQYRQVPIQIEAVKEEEHKAMGTGSGIL